MGRKREREGSSMRTSIAFVATFFTFLYLTGSTFTFFFALGAAIGVSVLWRWYLRPFILGKAAPSQSAVLVTGTSSGIGRETALQYAKKGLHVFAGVRKKSDAPEHVNITPLVVDITKDDEVKEAFETVSKELTKRDLTLWHVVNNAGMMPPSPVELHEDKDLRQLFDVNYFGHMAMMRTFLPKLREHHDSGKGDAIISFTTSALGETTLPLYGAYSSTKFALEGMLDALRFEVAPLGVKVMAFGYGSIQTPLHENTQGTEVPQGTIYSKTFEEMKKRATAYQQQKWIPTAEQAANTIVTNSLLRFLPQRLFHVGMGELTFPVLSYVPGELVFLMHRLLFAGPRQSGDKVKDTYQKPQVDAKEEEAEVDADKEKDDASKGKKGKQEKQKNDPGNEKAQQAHNQAKP